MRLDHSYNENVPLDNKLRGNVIESRVVSRGDLEILPPTTKDTIATQRNERSASYKNRPRDLYQRDSQSDKSNRKNFWQPVQFYYCRIFIAFNNICIQIKENRSRDKLYFCLFVTSKLIDNKCYKLFGT